MGACVKALGPPRWHFHWDSTRAAGLRRPHAGSYIYHPMFFPARHGCTSGKRAGAGGGDAGGRIQAATTLLQPSRPWEWPVGVGQEWGPHALQRQTAAAQPRLRSSSRSAASFQPFRDLAHHPLGSLLLAHCTRQLAVAGLARWRPLCAEGDRMKIQERLERVFIAVFAGCPAVVSAPSHDRPAPNRPAAIAKEPIPPT